MSADQKIIEREPRIFRSFTVRISEDLSVEKPRWDIVMTKDISASGILFNYDHYLEPGFRVHFKIALPYCGSVECEGEVVRNVMGTSLGFGSSSPAVCGIATVFRNIAEQDQQLMREFIAKCYVADVAEEDKDTPVKELKNQPLRERRIDRSFHTQIRKPQQTEWQTVSVQNISASGALFYFNEPLDVGGGLALRINLPFLTDPVVCWGKITRVEDKTRSGASVQVYDMAVGFSVFDENSKKQLREYAKEFGRE